MSQNNIGAAYWFAFRGSALLVREEGPVRVPEAASPEELDLDPYPYKPVGSLDGRPCYAVDLDSDAEPPEGTVFRDLRGLFATIDEGLFRLAGRAVQILEFDRTHQFCGRCSARTVQGPDELSKRCTRCGTVYHPRLSPASIVLVRRGDDELLLARSPGFPKGMYSVLAGFVEPGESIEETISREVLEEVGVEVRNVRYFGSQPWPFPHSLMIGFTADYAGGEIEPQAGEIEDAGWYNIDALPDLPPRVSIARAMIDAFVAENGRDGSSRG
ncbi:NAD(+) diphosphatase [Rubrobacter marinus]|uniref:NAD-capped RNA hydrolase NudC n=1 Tax=Rubrobacter marinus TaxID=2653852 RepID=A0A6G8Q065_9ACTN|nr:NAD(+) diphosphatase [Rubrobacter marinus]QIN79869.1 NAD(+) diphosphatase [Rubrobacter marinus]